MARLFKLTDTTQNIEIGNRIRIADNPLTRVRGLLGTQGLEEGEGLWITPCNSIHMFFMRYPIDCLFLSKELDAVKLVHAIAPWKMVLPVAGAFSVVELPAGWLEKKGAAEGDKFSFELLR